MKAMSPASTNVQPRPQRVAVGQQLDQKAIRRTGLLLIRLPLGGQIGVGADGAAQHPHKWSHPAHYLAAVGQAQLDDPARVRPLLDPLQPGPFQQRYGFVVPHRGHCACPFSWSKAAKRRSRGRGR